MNADQPELITCLFIFLQYLARNQISDLTRDNFTFNTKVNVGDVYEIRSGETVSVMLYFNRTKIFQ